ncbi:MAG: hypothetical protein E6095_13210 [Pseudescherichia vulneris]|nr:hypothetical protein [Pseudescherichia vulneris]
MKLKIRSVHEHGKANEEYVILDVNEDCDTQFYMITDTTFLPNGKISNRTRHTYRFESLQVKAGDCIALFTGHGVDKVETRNNGSKLFYCYWGLKTAVWNDDGDGAVLLEINAWETTKV